MHVKYKKNWKYSLTLDKLRILLKTKWLFSFLSLHFGNFLCSPKIGNEWTKKQLQSRWNEERGTLLGDTKETQTTRDTLPMTKSREKHSPGVSERPAAVHPSQLGTSITLHTI